MISALKRLVASNDGSSTANGASSASTSATGGPAPANGSSASLTANPGYFLTNGMQIISQSLQKKYSKGVNYNSKCWSLHQSRNAG